MNIPQKLLPLFYIFFCISSYLSAQTVRVTVEGEVKIKKEAAENRILQSDATGWANWVAPTNQQRKIIDVKDFGAVAGGTGGPDNTPFFQAAIDAATAFGGTVFIPPGNYLIENKLTIPSGVLLQGESQGNGYHRSSSLPFKGSVLHYSGSDYMLEFSGFFSSARDLFLYKIGAGTAGDQGCIRLIANDGQFSTGHNTFANLTVYNFSIGTGLKIEATNNSEIRNILVEDVLFRFSETAMHLLADETSTVENITLNNGKIGGGFQYSFRNQGGTNVNVYGTTFEGSACGSFGHLVVESGNINIYGFRLESTDPPANCDESEIKLIHFHPNTKGSYIQGLVGEGKVIDEGDNHLDVSGKNIERRPSGNNEFQNSGFRNVQNNELPFWELTGNLVSLHIEDPAFEAKHQVLTLTIAPGQIINLAPTQLGLAKAFNHQLATLGAYLKTDVANLATGRINKYNLSNGSCTQIDASYHTGNNEWAYIGLSTTIDEATCSPNPSFVFDNSSGTSNAVVSITTPSFVYGTTRPSLAAKPLSKSGGIVNGTLTHGMITLPIVNHDNFEVALPTTEGNTFLLTSTSSSANIHRLNNSTALGARFPKGTIITLLFESANVTVKNSGFINLLGAGNFSSIAGSSLTLVSLSGGTWREISRNL